MASPTPGPGSGYLPSTTVNLVTEGMANVVADTTAVLEAVLPSGLILIGIVLAVRMALRFFRMFGRA